MALDGIVIANLRYELSNALKGGRFSKIAMPEKDELLIAVKNNSSSYRLLISAGASLPLMYLTDINKQSPLIAPSFCMLLRKHIGTARIIDITQPGLERIICFTLEHLNELGDVCRKFLYVELMGKYSNIIFTDEDNTIIDSIKRVSSQVSSLREVLPGRKYYLPEQLKKADPLSISAIDFKSLISTNIYPLSKALYMSLGGISPLISDDICNIASLNSEADCSTLSDSEFTHLYNTMSLILDDIKQEKFSPEIILKNGKPVDFSSVHVAHFDYSEYSVKKYSSISALLFDFYSLRESVTRIRQKSADLRKIVNNAIERASKKLELQIKQLNDSAKKDKFKVYGDLLNTYGYELKGGEKSFTCLNFYDDNKELTIPLDSTMSSTENAKRFYDKYAKLKRTDEALSTEKLKTEADLSHLNSIMTSLDIAIEENDLGQIKEELTEYGYIKRHFTGKKQKILSKPLHYLSSDGFEIYVGKNNYQNDELTFKIATGNDWWFHAKGVPGSHVIVRSDNKELPDNTFEEAAALAAYYSKSRNTDKVEIDYIQKKNLKKVAGAAPGFVVYHTNWSMVVTPAINISQINEK